MSEGMAEALVLARSRATTVTVVSLEKSDSFIVDSDKKSAV